MAVANNRDMSRQRQMHMSAAPRERIAAPPAGAGLNNQ